MKIDCAAITLYDDGGPVALAVRLMLAALSAPVNVIATSQAPAGFEQTNPAGVLPMLLARPDTVIYGPGVIVDYLSERYYDPELLPGDAGQRAVIRMHLQRINQFFVPALLRSRGRTPEALAAKKDLWEALAELTPLVEQVGPFILGGKMSVLDCFIGAVLYMAEAQHGLPKDLKPLQRYLGRLMLEPKLQSAF